MLSKTLGAAYIVVGALVVLAFTCFRRLYMFVTGRVEEEETLDEVPLPEEPLKEEQVHEPNVEVAREVEDVKQIRHQQLVRIEVRRINKLGRQQLAKAKQAERNRLFHEKHDRPTKPSKQPSLSLVVQFGTNPPPHAPVCFRRCRCGSPKMLHELLS